MARRDVAGVSEILDAIDRLYSAVESDDPVGPFLESLEGLFADGPCALITHDASRNVETGAFRSLDSTEVQRYAAHYSKISPWFQPDKAIQRFFEGKVVTYEESLPAAEYFKTEYYNDWGRKNHVAHGMGTAVTSSPELTTFVSVNRSSRLGAMTEAEVRVLQMLAPHLARAVRLRARLEEARTLQAAMERGDWATFVVTGGLRILYANGKGDGMLRSRDGLGLRDGKLVTTARGDQRELERIVRQAATIGPVDESCWIGRVRRPGIGGWHTVYAHALPSDARVAGTGVRILLYIVDPQKTEKLPAGLLDSAFGLTRAEAALAGKLWEDPSLVRSAERLDISVNTAKTQLQAIFAKTGTASQAELLRLLAKAMAPAAGKKNVRPEGE